ncbi:hypothetical protein J6590_089829 [Homalodisca vitripennis]|nr:hypothetical protein J6590_004664 [Homalodisca vitripennis]KAG8314584.1 hypothetical protein J6590_089829 [Homalodisca vitripennis]
MKSFKSVQYNGLFSCGLFSDANSCRKIASQSSDLIWCGRRLMKDIIETDGCFLVALIYTVGGYPDEDLSPAVLLHILLTELSSTDRHI